MATMREAQKKSTNRFLIIAGLVYATILALFFVIPSYPKDWADRAGFGWNIVGVIATVLSYVTLYRAAKSGRASTTEWIAFILLLVFGVTAMAGFNFDFVGIAERP